MRCSVTAVCLLFTLSVWAENLYVRPDGGSYGTETGTDWNNAFDGFGKVQFGSGTGKVGAGDTLFIAGGKFTSKLRPTVDGTSSNLLVIKKATAQVHGTNTGWSAGMEAQTQVVGASIDLMSRSHLVLDGSYEYGIRMSGLTDGGGVQKYIWIGAHVDNEYASDLTIKYVEIEGPGDLKCDHTGGIGVFGYHRRVDNFTISHVKVYEFSGAGIRTGEHEGLLIENCVIYNVQNASAAACDGNNPHNTHIALYGGIQTDDVTIRNNYFYQETAGEVKGGYAIGFGTDLGNCDIYNNVFMGMSNPIKCSELDMPTVPGATINLVNNTIVGVRTMDWGSGGSYFNMINNVFCSKDFSPVRQPYPADLSVIDKGNVFYNDAYAVRYDNGSNIILPAGQVPFADYTNQDITLRFRLAADGGAVDVAADMSHLFTTDINGNPRPAGKWDAGAFEYSTTNVGCRTLNAERRIPHHLKMPNPVKQTTINDIRLTIDDVRLNTILGKKVSENSQVKPGVYYIQYQAAVQKIVVVE